MLNTPDGRILEIRPGDGWGALFACRGEDGEEAEAWVEGITYWALHAEGGRRCWVGYVPWPLEDAPCTEAPDFVCYLGPDDSHEAEDHAETVGRELRYREAPDKSEALRRAGYRWEEFRRGRWVSPHDGQLLTTRRAFEEMEASPPEMR